MATPVLSTKLFVPPQRPQSIARTRLIDRLDYGRGAGRKLTLICAPAGFGKTTLLSEWVATVQRREPTDRIAWLSLDDGDNDPARFLVYLLAAFDRTHSRTGFASTELALTQLINRIGHAPHSFVLILDDFQAIGAAPVREAVSYLLEHQPPTLHVVIASRSDPLLPLARMRGGGELSELRAADLRFTPDEAAAFLNQTMGLGLSPADIAALETRTEGWIAGLQLAALSMRERSDVNGFIEAFTGSNRFVIDYLGEEVLQRQPDDVRAFLLHTAFLERLSAPLCNAVTGRTDSGELLDRLEHENLFVVPLDDERHWYRYHNLFADVLQARSRRENPARVPELHRLASEWHERNDLVEEAIGYALAAEDFARTARLIEHALPELRRRRRDSTLLAWLRLLPADTASRMPVLSTFYAWSSLVGGDLDGVERRLNDAQKSLEGEGGHDSAPGEELEKLPVTIAAYRASIAQARGDVAGTERHARRALALAAPNDHLGRGAGGGLLALALWAQGDLASAVQTFADAMTSLERAGHVADVISATLVMADMLVVQGRRIDARRSLQRALELAEAHGGAVSTMDLHVGMSELAREEDDLDAATRHLVAGTEPGLHPTVPENAHRWYVAMSRVREAEGDLDAALALLNEAERLYVRGYFPDIRPISAMRIRIFVRQQRLSDAVAWIAEQGLSADDDLDYLREFHHLTLARVLIAQFRSDRTQTAIVDATRLLERLLPAAEAGGRGGSVSEILVLQALGLEAQGQITHAQLPLRRVLQHAAAEGYVRLFVDEGEPMIRLLKVAAREEALPRHLRHLISSTPLPAGQTSAAQGAEHLSERELSVLRLLDTELSGPQIARELFVSVNTLRTHTNHIFRKLSVNSRPAAVRRAREQGLI